MDIVTTYLYESLDSNIYMKIPEGFKMSEAYKWSDRSLYLSQLQWSLYRLKQSECMWYNRLNEYLIKEGYINDHIYLCVFIRKFEFEFAIVAVYVNDMNLIGTLEDLLKNAKYLKRRNWNERLRENKLLSQPTDRA